MSRIESACSPSVAGGSGVVPRTRFELDTHYWHRRTTNHARAHAETPNGALAAIPAVPDFREPLVPADLHAVPCRSLRPGTHRTAGGDAGGTGLLGLGGSSPAGGGVPGFVPSVPFPRSTTACTASFDVFDPK